LAAAGLVAYLVGGLPGGLGGLAFAEVEVQAAEQQPQPASGHQQVAVLPQGEPSAQELVLTGPLPELSEPNQKRRSGSSRQRQRSAMIAG
jgi:hypothetical protein